MSTEGSATPAAAVHSSAPLPAHAQAGPAYPAQAGLYAPQGMYAPGAAQAYAQPAVQAPQALQALAPPSKAEGRYRFAYILSSLVVAVGIVLLCVSATQPGAADTSACQSTFVSDYWNYYSSSCSACASGGCTSSCSLDCQCTGQSSFSGGSSTFCFDADSVYTTAAGIANPWKKPTFVWGFILTALGCIAFTAFLFAWRAAVRKRFSQMTVRSPLLAVGYAPMYNYVTPQVWGLSI